MGPRIASLVVVALLTSGCTLAEDQESPSEDEDAPTQRSFAAVDCRSVGVGWNADINALRERWPEGLESASDTIFTFTVACIDFVTDGLSNGPGAMHVLGTHIAPVVTGTEGDEHAFLFDQVFTSEIVANWWRDAGYPAFEGPASNKVRVEAVQGRMHATSENGTIDAEVVTPPAGSLASRADRAIHLYAADGSIVTGSAEEFVYGSPIALVTLDERTWHARLGADDTPDFAWIALPVSFTFEKGTSWK